MTVRHPEPVGDAKSKGLQREATLIIKPFNFFSYKNLVLRNLSYMFTTKLFVDKLCDQPIPN